MPDQSLDADYDRDGKISGTGAERRKRDDWPGAVVVANLDRDAKKLAVTVKAGEARPKLDLERSVKHARDDELTKLVVRVHKPPPTPCRFFLKVLAWDAGRFAIIDAKRRRLPAPDGLSNAVEVPWTGKDVRLSVETTTLAASPLLRPGTTSVSRFRGTLDQRNLRLQLICVENNGTQTVVDSGRFTVAPFILLDDSHDATRMYICEAPENTGAVADVESALRDRDVELVKVPADVNQGDSWLQDQFQVGHCRDATGWMTVVAHMPRLRSDFVQIAAPVDAYGKANNLATFVASHFAGRDVGLFDDFWKRTTPYDLADGTGASLTFEEGAAVRWAMSTVFQLFRDARDLREQLLAQAVEHAEKNKQGLTTKPIPPFPKKISAARSELADEVRKAGRAVDRAIEKGTSTWSTDILEARKAALAARLDAIDEVVKFESKAATLQIIVGRVDATITGTVADELDERLGQMHSSTNYGGNIEVSPPVEGAPLGKIVVGNVSTDTGETMDVDLLRFLRGQWAQPIVEIETRWLSVAHVDELISFVPDQRSKADAAILRASPAIALAIVREAAHRYLGGLEILDPERDGVWSPSYGNKTAKGTSPVTAMFRGKRWLHHHPPRALMAAEPPWLYRRLASVNANFQFSVHDWRYQPGESNHERHYPARMTVIDYLAFHNATNRVLEATFLADLDDQLRDAFPALPVLPVPVLFDDVPTRKLSKEEQAFLPDETELPAFDRGETTSAFTPNLVNLQVINGALLVPRPFGPRMSTPQAIDLVKHVLSEYDMAAQAKFITKKFVEAKGLAESSLWVNATGDERSAGDLSLRQVAEEVSDGFPDKSTDEVVEILRKANRKHLRKGSLRSGWRKLNIPEATVDLFELYFEAVAASLGLEVKWIDSWFYHVRHGEIHCGTNVIRAPRKGTPTWWSVREETDLELTQEIPVDEGLRETLDSQLEQ